MRTVYIPDADHPFVCEINNTKYEYPQGTMQTVPDEVAELIENYYAQIPEPSDFREAPAGSVWTYGEDGKGGWGELPSGLPDASTASAGDVLELDSNKKPKWSTPESELPSTGSASEGDVLSLNASKEPVWSAPSGGFDVNVKFTVTAGSDASHCLYKFYKTDGTSYSNLIDLIDVADENGYFYALWVSQIGSDVNLGIDEAGMLCRFKIFDDNGTYKIVIPKLFLTLYISGGTKFVRTDAAVLSFAATATAEMSDSITAFSFGS